MKIFKNLLFVAFFGVAALSYIGYTALYAPNVKKAFSMTVAPKAAYSEVLKQLVPHLNNTLGFTTTARLKKYPSHIKAGYYTFEEGLNNIQLVNKLRSGDQTPIKITFNNQDNLNQLAGRISQQIAADSLSLNQSFSELVQSKNISKAAAISYFLPNSYEVYWTISPKTFVEKMLKAHQQFWTNERKAKAKKQKLTPLEVSILASIVHKETNHVQERRTVAGLYLNRLQNNWPLQADPTVVYALQQKYPNRGEVHRVLNKDLGVVSPFNTYLHSGLPPAPIGMPDLSALEAVLNPEKHNYFYMCASSESIGKHCFAKTLKEHLKNARKYQNWLTKQGIMK